MAALIWLGFFGWYLVSASPSLGGEDSGEFTAAAATLGISHAPGYPLFALAGRLWCLLPLGSVAFRLNLLSACAMAGAVAGAFGLVRRLAGKSFGASRGAAMFSGGVAAVLLGGAPVCWYQAGLSDKYPFHLALFTVAVRLACASAPWPAQAFWLGLGCCHHLQMLYVVPGLAWQVLRSRRMTARAAVLSAALVMLTLSPKLLYPPVRAGAAPFLAVSSPRQAAPLIRYLRAGIYAGRMRGPGPARWRDTGTALIRQLGWAGLLTGVIGLAAIARRAPAPGTFLCLTALTGLGLTASLEISGREFYLMPVVWIAAAGTGALVAALLAVGGTVRRRMGASAAACVVAGIALPAHLTLLQRAGNSLEYDTGRDLLASLPPRTALFVGEDDFIYPLFHLQLVEACRPDVLVIPEGALSSAAWRSRLQRAAPELAGPFSRQQPAGDEEAWSRIAVSALAHAGRAVALTNPAREGLWRGRQLEPRELVYEVFRGEPRIPVRRPQALRARGWFAPAKAMTEREWWLLAIYASRQWQYAELLTRTGRARDAGPRLRRALRNPYLVVGSGTAGEHPPSVRAGGMGPP